MSLSSNNWIKFYKSSPDSEATLPVRATSGAAAYDLMASDFELFNIGEYNTYYTHTYNNHIRFKTGLSLILPDGFVGDLRARSSIHKLGLRLANGAGVIDSDYRGEIIAVYASVKSISSDDAIELMKKPIAQIFFTRYYTAEEKLGSFEELDIICKREISEGSNNRKGGFGSTDVDDIQQF